MKNQLLILAALLLTALSARAQHEYIMTVDRFYPNDGDCYDGILFQFHSQKYPYFTYEVILGLEIKTTLHHIFN